MLIPCSWAEHNGGRSPWHEGASDFIVDRNESMRPEIGTTYNLQSYAPSSLLPPMKPHYLKFPEPLKVVQLAGYEALNI